MAKYNSVLQLAVAFRNGMLRNYVLTLDNDSARLRYNGPMDEEGNLPDGRTVDEVNDECAEWYRGKGYRDLQEAHEAAGVPCEWC